MKSPRRLVTLAHAKVNLDLRVLGTRADGFHELRTVFQTIDLHDSLTCIEQPGAFALRCRTPGVPLDASNLVWRAAASLWKALGREGEPRDTVVALEKTIPMESGLGGGSADAAAALVGAGSVVGRRAGHAAPRRRIRDRRRRGVFPVRRNRAGARARRRNLPARRSSAALGRRRAAAVWRVDGGSVFLVRRGSHGRAARRRASSRFCRCHGPAGRPRWSTTSSRPSSAATRRSAR